MNENNSIAKLEPSKCKFTPLTTDLPNLYTPKNCMTIVWVQICTYLSLKELVNFGLVCKKFYGIHTTDSIWRELYRTMVPNYLKNPETYGMTNYLMLKRDRLGSNNRITAYHILTLTSELVVCRDFLCSMDPTSKIVSIFYTKTGTVHDLRNLKASEIIEGSLNRLITKSHLNEERNIFDLNALQVLNVDIKNTFLTKSYENKLDFGSYENVKEFGKYILLFGKTDNPGIHLWNIETGKFLKLFLDNKIVEEIRLYLKDGNLGLFKNIENYFCFPCINEKQVIFDLNTEEIKTLKFEKNYEDYTILGSQLVLFKKNINKEDFFNIEVVNILTGEMSEREAEPICWHQNYKNFLLTRTETKIKIFNNDMTLCKEWLHNEEHHEAITWQLVGPDALVTGSDAWAGGTKIWSIPDGKLLCQKNWLCEKDNVRIVGDYLEIIVNQVDLKGLYLWNIKTNDGPHQFKFKNIKKTTAVIGVRGSHMFIFNEKIYIYNTKDKKMQGEVEVPGKFIKAFIINNVTIVQYENIEGVKMTNIYNIPK